jgi:hypothetical protein
MIQSIETGRKEDGNRSIADKIIKRLHDIEMTVENNHGRWAWELLQNAKDSVADSERKVSVEIELNKESVVFRHNGTHFTEKDVRGLINQISSKEVEEGQESKKTGKFGTGFLTTHLLSKVIQVEGIVETVDNDFYRFSFPLDRDGKTTGQLIPKIETAWASFHESTEDNQIDEYDEDDFNTSFTYNLATSEQKEIARIGVDEFTQLIPFVLAFIPVIDSVNIIDKIKNTTAKFENSEELEDDVLLNIIKTENKKKYEIKLLFAKEEDVAIASIVEENQNGYAIKNLKDFPKLFCDFPLIGTEDFHFPVIVNSFYFNPLMERDGIWLRGDGKQEVEENREILEKAVELYEQLLEKITDLNYCDYHNICLSKIPSTNEKYFDDKWYQTNIQRSLREIITKSKVVETEDDKVLFSDVRFPDPELKKDEREKIWKFSSDLKVNTLPAKKHIHKWADLIWKDIARVDVSDIVTDLKGKTNLTELINTLETDESQAIAWLNNCIDFIYEIGGQTYFNNNELLPNQEGNFKKRKEVSIDDIEDETLKEISSLLGYNFYEDLLHKDIYFEDSHSTTTIQDVATEISKLIKDDESIDEDRILAIRKLAEWFEYNPEKGKTHFEALYRRKEKLFVDTIEDKENLYRVLKTKTPLSKLAEVAKAIENDPEILDLIARRQKEREEEIERNEVGEKVEKVLAEALQQHGFEVKKEIYGRDLVITLKKKNAKYSVEVKSTSRKSYVSMTPFQASSAVQESDNYALCVVQKNGSVVNKDYIRKNAKFVIDIGDKLQNKVEEVSEFESTKTEIANTNEDIDLFYENSLEYKYKISSNIWTKGKGFWDFIKHISES